jgi:hypothetical protein
MKRDAASLGYGPLKLLFACMCAWKITKRNVAARGVILA